MSSPVRKLGILLSGDPGQPGFGHGLGLAEAALDERLEVYLYCLDRAVAGLADPRLGRLQERGARLFACAHAVHERGLSPDRQVILAGLSVLSDLMADTDRFVSFA